MSCQNTNLIAHNLNDTSKLSTKTSNKKIGQLISPGRKIQHKKNNSAAFNCTDTIHNPPKGRGPKIGLDGSGQ